MNKSDSRSRRQPLLASHGRPWTPAHLRACRKERSSRIQELRWTHRTLPEHVKGNLSPLELQFFRGYDRLLNKHMRSGKGGVGLDLTADPTPPDAPWGQVRQAGTCCRTGLLSFGKLMHFPASWEAGIYTSQPLLLSPLPSAPHPLRPIPTRSGVSRCGCCATTARWSSPAARFHWSAASHTGYSGTRCTRC